MGLEFYESSWKITILIYPLQTKGNDFLVTDFIFDAENLRYLISKFSEERKIHHFNLTHQYFENFSLCVVFQFEDFRIDIRILLDRLAYLLQ